MTDQAVFAEYEYCSGCHSCEVACQQEHGLEPGVYGIKLHQVGPDEISPRVWQLDNVPIVTDRCDRCAERREAGKLPLCEQSCQAGCIRVAPLEELLPLAQKATKYAIYG